MDQQQYNSFVEVLKGLVDPRKARGKRHPWWLILTLIASALASGQKNGRAIGQWVQEHRDELLERLQPASGQLPSVATLRRALRLVALTDLETQVAAYTQACLSQEPRCGTIQTAEGERLQGQAVDGKALRGANARGRKLHLVSLTQHGGGQVLGQVEVQAKSNEITAVPRLLAGRQLQGTVITMDALLTQVEIAQQILTQGGQYFMVVKENHPTLYQEIGLLFDSPPWQSATEASLIQHHQTINKGHGRLEYRTLEASPALNDFLTWPGVAQVVKRTCRRVILKTGQVTQETTYAITSLAPAQASPAALETLWRGHWTIENRLHYPRDVTFGEDACAIRVGNAPRALAVFRNLIIALFRHAGWQNLADALRHYGAAVSRPLDLLGLPLTRL
jgi:predicted transposase YbfD/YdcC